MPLKKMEIHGIPGRGRTGVSRTSKNFAKSVCFLRGKRRCVGFRKNKTFASPLLSLSSGSKHHISGGGLTTHSRATNHEKKIFLARSVGGLWDRLSRLFAVTEIFSPLAPCAASFGKGRDGEREGGGEAPVLGPPVPTFLLFSLLTQGKERPASIMMFSHPNGQKEATSFSRPPPAVSFFLSCNLADVRGERMGRGRREKEGEGGRGEWGIMPPQSLSFLLVRRRRQRSYVKEGEKLSLREEAAIGGGERGEDLLGESNVSPSSPFLSFSPSHTFSSRSVAYGGVSLLPSRFANSLPAVSGRRAMQGGGAKRRGEGRTFPLSLSGGGIGMINSLRVQSWWGGEREKEREKEKGVDVERSRERLN